MSYLSEPATDIIPTNTNNITPFEASPARVLHICGITLEVFQKVSVAKAEIVDQTVIFIVVLRADRFGEFTIERYFAHWGVHVPSNEAFIAFSYNIGLTTSGNVVKTRIAVRVHFVATHFMMPCFTTARTTAFIPALSPPEVNTAILNLCVGLAIAD